MTRWTIAPETALATRLLGRASEEGMRSAFTRSTSNASTAGSSVGAAITETIPTRIAPAARLRKIVLGTSSSPSIASTNATPLKNTARPAVAPAVAIAFAFSALERSSR